MKAKEITNYLKNKYGECRHDARAMASAINEMSDILDHDKWDLFHLLVENKPINSLMTHSYGFHTADGRGIINEIQDKYYEYKSNN